MKFVKRTLVIILILILIIGATSFVSARYITSQREKTQMTSSGFHISSNYLKEPDVNAVYTLVDWGSGFDIDLYNYETSNIALIAEDAIDYTIAVTDGWTASVNKKASSSYTLEQSNTRSSQTIHIAPLSTNKATGSTITVTVTTTAPYKKTLKAVFSIESKSIPDYFWVIDSTTGVTTLTIRTNDYSGTYTVKWDSAYYTPNTTNSLESSWEQADGIGTFISEQDSTYTLEFLMNGSPLSSVNGTGSGTTVELK